MTKRKFFIDTDTASDDAVALLMALEYPDVEVLGVSLSLIHISEPTRPY